MPPTNNPPASSTPPPKSSKTPLLIGGAVGAGFLVLCGLCLCGSVGLAALFVAQATPSSKPIARATSTAAVAVQGDVPTLAPQAEALPTNTPAPIPAAPKAEIDRYDSGGLGVSRAQWEETRQATGEGEIGTLYAATEVGFENDNIWFINYPAGLTLAEAEADAQSLIPVDSQLVRNYTEANTDNLVYLYTSNSLAQRFTNNEVWDGDTPGTFSVSFATSDDEDRVTYLYIQTGSLEEASSSEPAAETAYKIGDNVTVGEVRWLITEAKDEGQTLKSDNEFIEPKTTAGKFLRLSFEVENLGKEPKSFMGLDVVDSQGRTFQNYAEGLFFIEQGVQCIIKPINPGVPIQCQAIYELPANAEGLAANPGDLNMFGGEAAVIMLQ